MKKELVVNLLFLFLVNAFLFFVPLLLNNKFLIILFFFINAYVSWMILKKIEKGYYKRYKNFFSLLYMSCPLIGVSVLIVLLYYFKRSLMFKTLMFYYIPLYLVILVINLGYIILKKVR